MGTGTVRDMRRDINGMVALITGASAGIGRALARDLHGRGARLVLSARRTDRLAELNAELGGNHLAVTADVARTDDCDRLVAEAIARFGRIDALVCNAGYGLVRRVADTTPAEMRDIFATNVFGTTDVIHAAVPHLLKQEPMNGLRAHILIVSSAAGRRGLPYFGAYSATKAAQLSLAEALRVELRPQRIAVTSVHPVGTSSDFFTTAATVSKSRLPIRHGIEVQQTPELVAAKIARALARPRPELWPLAPSRLMLSVATLFPSLADRALAGRKPR